MRVTSKLAKTERKRQDSSVRHAAKRGRTTKVTRIRGPIHPQSSDLTTAVEAGSAKHLIWRQDQAKLTSRRRPLGECRFKAEAAATPNENERISHFAQMSLEGAFEGAKRMKQKFPNENSIDDFISRLGQYAAKANQEHNGRETAPDIMVGETNGDKIGCYLLWFVKKGETERSYHSVATSLDRLKEDYVHFFEQIVEQKKEILRQLPDRRPASETRRTSDGGLKIPTSDLIRNQHEHDLKVAENCLKNTFFIEKYLDSEAGKKPFIEIGGMEIWIGTGVRPRQKMNGEYVE
jgi:hypothetical protein